MKRVLLRQLRSERGHLTGVSLVRVEGVDLDELRAIVRALDGARLHSVDAARFEVGRVVDGAIVDEA